METSWPITVFADLDSFSVRYDRFYRVHFNAGIGDLPSWLDIDAGSLAYGERVLARTAPLAGNEDEIQNRLLDLVSMDVETGLTQFSPEPAFSPDYFILGHRERMLTLVRYDALAVRDTLQGLDVIRYLAERGAFLAAKEDAPQPVVLSRGNASQVEMWYPQLAREVLHTHTIPGNINPTGYLEYFPGSDRDLSVVSFRFQDPIRRLLLSRRPAADPGDGH
jgi:hypothetical protein